MIYVWSYKHYADVNGMRIAIFAVQSHKSLDKVMKYKIILFDVIQDISSKYFIY